MTKSEKSLDKKVAVVLEMLKGKESVDDICERHKVSIADAYRWCALFLEGAKKAFGEGYVDKPLSQEEIEKIKKIIGE
jgi:transposase-like protein